MGCACGTKEEGKVSGCQSHGSCSTGGCNRLNSFDWLSDMEVPAHEKFDVVEIRFKNGRKEFFRNTEKLLLHTGDAVVVEVPSGHHIGHVSLQGELVRLQMKKKNVANDDEIKKIYRLAHAKDLEKFEEVKKREHPTIFRGREIIQKYKLQMKLSDVEFQADNMKAIFYYSAEERVDFRELIKALASEFRIRVEMRQISLRQEAGRLGGIGVCGRELCCSTWLTDFKNVATSAARYQNLSLNPAKLSGQCGRLKCCLNYELETYMDALRDIPKVESPLQTLRGDAFLQKTDIFRKIMWFGYKEENTWFPLDVERVNQILEQNQKGVKPATLEKDLEEQQPVPGPLNNDLAQLDHKFKNKSSKRRKKGRSGQGGRGQMPRAQRPTGNKPQ
ncbi:MAG: Signal peptidase-like protein [Bacteroidetes bacterium]|nr:Signal peptidase-like protein [Bacteroidota bacterium]